ncbi:MAG TPA: hypothetical protein VFP84_22805 [Kofleriaceae bacterium]|nr:hypothetical protein [Kofleriaceae bacterium]
MRRALALALLLASPVARADAPRAKPAALEVDRDAAPGGRLGFGFDGGAPVETWGVSLTTSWLDRPIRLARGTFGAGTPASDPVRHRETVALGAALAVGDAVVLDAIVRGSHQVGDRLHAAGDPRDLRRAVFHDLGFGARIRVAGGAARAVFLRADFTLPSGNDLHFAGDERYTVAWSLIGRARLPADVVLAGTVGVRLHGAEVAIADRVISDELRAAAGVEVPVAAAGALGPLGALGALGLTGEVLAAIGDDARKLAGQAPVEARLGAIVRPQPALALGVAIGAGLDDAIGAPRWRAVATVAWTPPADPAPARPAEPDACGSE